MTDTDAMATVNGSSTILRGDVIEQLRSFDDNTFDACLCDPPYLLEFMGKEFDKQHLQMEGSNDGQKMYQWHLGWCQELYRVLKPGAFAMVFGGTRTYYRLACALEDVGFEIRDTIEWMYGSGFPKSHDISKGIDKTLGIEREVIGRRSDAAKNNSEHSKAASFVKGKVGYKEEFNVTIPSEQSALWSGYGTALKPAHEPIILCMKPCDGTFAENALEHGVAGLNIDGCRIESNRKDTRHGGGVKGAGSSYELDPDARGYDLPSGRWPANLILSHTPYCQLKVEFVGENPMVPEFDCHPLCPVRLLDEQSGERGSTLVSGGASRFFYCAKVSTRERNAGNIDCKHPTLKPIDLCRYLATLLLPPPREDDLRQIIVPFSGAGSEVAGALSAGWEMVIGIEADPEYIKWSESRIPSLTNGEPLKPAKRSPKPDPTLDLDLDIFS